VIERTALAEWMGRARNLIEQQGNAPPAAGPPARRSPSKAGAALGGAVVLLIFLAAFYVAASTPSAARANTPSARHLSPAAAVIEANFAAINRHDWRTVWQLWYHSSPGYGPGYSKMISGYRLNALDVVTSLKASGDAVSARVLAHETTGSTQTYDFSYKVHARAGGSCRRTRRRAGSWAATCAASTCCSSLPSPGWPGW
jgi:hypothetical protein